VIRDELSKEKLIFDDRVDVPPAHCVTCVESRRNLQECKEWRIPGKNLLDLGAV
jgi:hypothetical protein